MSLAAGFCCNHSSTRNLTNQLSEDSDQLIKRVQSGVLFLGWNKNLQRHGSSRWGFSSWNAISAHSSAGPPLSTHRGVQAVKHAFVLCFRLPSQTSVALRHPSPPRDFPVYFSSARSPCACVLGHLSSSRTTPS